MPFIQLATQAGAPVKAGQTTVTPFSQALTIRLPFLPGGFVWNRPVSVMVSSGDGQEVTLPIRDVTRLRQIAMFAVGLVGGVLIWLIFRKR